MYKIETGVPLPEKHSRGRRSYPFPDMSVGDSFGVPFDNDEEARKIQKAVGSAATLWKNRNAKLKKFVTRMVKEKMEVRCWRIK